MTTAISSDLITGGPENNSQSAEKTRQFRTIETDNKVQSNSYPPNDKFMQSRAVHVLTGAHINLDESANKNYDS